MSILDKALLFIAVKIMTIWFKNVIVERDDQDKYVMSMTFGRDESKLVKAKELRG